MKSAQIFPKVRTEILYNCARRVYSLIYSVPTAAQMACTDYGLPFPVPCLRLPLSSLIDQSTPFWLFSSVFCFPTPSLVTPFPPPSLNPSVLWEMKPDPAWCGGGSKVPSKEKCLRNMRTPTWLQPWQPGSPWPMAPAYPTLLSQHITRSRLGPYGMSSGLV